MIISKTYISPVASELLHNNPLAQEAYQQILESIRLNSTTPSGKFVINSSAKNANGVVPVKENIYINLEEGHGWFREKPLPYLVEAKKGGPIDVYNEFDAFKVGIEFETGNISSAHRAMNKLCVGIRHQDIDMGVLMLSVKALSYYLTDRVSNYEELEPYFVLLDDYPFIVIGFDADEYDDTAPILPKGKDGMSQRAIHKWKDK